MANPHDISYGGAARNILDRVMSGLPGGGRWRHYRVSSGDMVPDLREGDWVTVDVDDRIPSPPGVFLLWSDREGLLLRNVEVMPNSEPLMVRVSSAARSKSAEVILAADVCVEARVCGVWRPSK